MIKLPCGTMLICELEYPVRFGSRMPLYTSMEPKSSRLCYASGPLSVARLGHGAFVLVLRSCFTSWSIRACAMEKKFDTLQNHLPRDRFGRAHNTSASRESNVEDGVVLDRLIEKCMSTRKYPESSVTRRKFAVGDCATVYRGSKR
jgi:hypothetical protein